MAPTAPPYTVPRANPRIFWLLRARHFDLPFQLTKDPETVDPRLEMNQSDSGKIETISNEPVAYILLLMEAMDARTRALWKFLWDMVLQPGELVELIADSSRCFWLAGDSDVDLASGSLPIDGSTYTMRGAPAGSYGQGALSVDRAQASGTRANLFDNGDFIDGTYGVIPPGWTNSDPATLNPKIGQYLLPNGDAGRMLEVSAFTAGAGELLVDAVDLDGSTVSTLPGDLLWFHFLARADRAPGTPATDILTVNAIYATGPTTVSGPSFTLTHEWKLYHGVLDFGANVATDSEVQIQFAFSSALRLAPVSITEIQFERGGHTAFLPYSTIRTELTGARSAAEMARWLNGLAYRHQLPAWVDDRRWEFTVGAVFTPHWDSADIPGATLVLYQDGDDLIDTVAALKITVTEDSIVATATLADGDEVVATLTPHSWSAFVGVTILATFRDWDGDEADTGTLALYVDGALAELTPHSGTGLRQGRWFSLGSTLNNNGVASGDFSDVFQDEIFVDNTVVTAASYKSTAALPVRPDRNSFRAVMDKGQKGRSDIEVQNTVPLECRFVEVR